MRSASRRGFLSGLVAAVPASCVLDGRLKLPIHYEPADLDDGLAVGAPETVGIDPDALRAAYERFFSEDEYILGRSLLFMRRGVLVGEGYARDRADRQRLQHVKSVSKSLTSLVTGLALDRGVLPSLDTALGELLVEARERGEPYASSTLRWLLTMRSGLDWDNAVHTGELMIEEPSNTVGFILDRPIARTPGGDTNYCDADPHLVGAAIARRAGASLEELARRWLFEPLGIRDVRWEHGRDDLDYAAYGAWLRPRDMARVGELVRMQGAWAGQSLVPSAWLEESLQPHVRIGDEPYGYYWWSRDAFASGSWAADGHGGQYIHVMPEQELVCVQTALPYTPTHEHGIVIEETEELIAMVIEGLLD